ncbi:MAG: hypothetical protein RR291_05930, partial [Clostridia bacterium]
MKKRVFAFLAVAMLAVVLLLSGCNSGAPTSTAVRWKVGETSIYEISVADIKPVNIDEVNYAKDID